MQTRFIRVGAATCSLGLAGAAFAGGGERFDVSFSDVDIFNANLPVENLQTADTAGLGGRYFASFGHSNIDIDVCWNTGVTYSGWASELAFVMEMEDGTAAGEGALFVLAPSPFAGDDTGSDVEGACSNRQALDEIDNPFTAFTFQVANDGLVDCGITATWDDGTGLRHSFCNTASFYFTLGADAPASCIGGTGSCIEVHSEPGCDDQVCCATTCDVNAGGDPFCCDSTWDSTCVELATALCDIFVYSCDAPAFANDCATSPTALSNGDSIAFDTTLANVDGPAISCADGGAANAWFLVSNDGLADQQLTASTCNQALYDTALTLYDAGSVGSPIDPTTLGATEVACNDDGAGCADFSSTLIGTMEAGKQYLISVSGYQGAVGSGTLSVSWETPEPPIDPYTCDAPGPDSFSQTVTGAVLQDNAVACAAGGITDANGFARIYSAADVGADAFTIDCIEFGIANSGSYCEGAVNVYTTPNATPAPLADMTLVASAPYGFYPTAGAELSVVSFDGGADIDLSSGDSLVIEFSVNPSLDGFAAIAGGVAADVSSGTTYIRSDACGITEYADYASIGFDVEWFVSVLGTSGGGGTPCPADFNGDNVVDGADFGQILASWGPCPAPCPADLDGNGEVNGADVGLVLSQWGPCP